MLIIKMWRYLGMKKVIKLFYIIWRIAGMTKSFSKFLEKAFDQ